MKSLALVLIALAILACSLPAMAGPLTGAPAIKFIVGDDTESTPSYGLGVGFTTFNFDLKVTVLGTTVGDTWSQSGPIVSGEYSRPLTGGKSLAFGGWLAPVGSTAGHGNMTLGEVHGRYSFTPNLGLEVGGLIFDTNELGKMLVHAVYQTEFQTAKPIKFQAGLGVLTGTTITDAGVTLGKFNTGMSVFANASYPFSESLNGYVAAWGLFQKFQFASGLIPGATIPDMTSNTVQWSLGLSRSF